MTIIGKVNLLALALDHEAQLARADRQIRARKIQLALWRQSEAHRRLEAFPFPAALPAPGGDPRGNSPLNRNPICDN